MAFSINAVSLKSYCKGNNVLDNIYIDFSLHKDKLGWMNVESLFDTFLATNHNSKIAEFNIIHTHSSLILYNYCMHTSP